MTDELKSAIDRLRRINAGDTPTAVYRFDKLFVLMHSDYKLVAEAYLARLADDEAGEEPVTEESLEKLGFRESADGIHMESPDHVILFSYWGRECTVCNAKPNIKTVRQLRRLIEVLQGDSK